MINFSILKPFVDVEASIEKQKVKVQKSQENYSQIWELNYSEFDENNLNQDELLLMSASLC